MNTKEASDYLRERHGISRTPATLHKLRVIGGGPRFRKRNRAVDYLPEYLDDFAAEITGPTVRSTSELREAVNAA